MDADDGLPAASSEAVQPIELSSPARSATGSASDAVDDSFGNINTPSLRAQRALLDSPPPMTQPANIQKGTWANLRKPRGHVDSKQQSAIPLLWPNSRAVLTEIISINTKLRA